MTLHRRTLCLALAGAALPATGQPPATAGDPPGVQRRPWPADLPAPALDLPAWPKGSWQLSQARGQVVVLNFWASWCEPCVAELPSLERLARRHAADGLQVLALNFRERDSAIERFLARHPVALPILRDLDGATAKACRVRVFPTTVVLARHGRPAFTVTGELDWSGPEAAAWLAPLLKS